MSLYPDPSQWFAFVACQDNNFSDIPDYASECAQQVGLDWNSISNCVSNQPKVDALMYATINRTNSLGWNPRPGSPTVYVGGNCVYGYSPCKELDPTTNQVRNYICKLYQGPKPQNCTSIKEALILG